MTQGARISTAKGQIKRETRAESSDGICDEVGRAKSTELIWHELQKNSKNQQIDLKRKIRGLMPVGI